MTSSLPLIHLCQPLVLISRHGNDQGFSENVELVADILTEPDKGHTEINCFKKTCLLH